MLSGANCGVGGVVLVFRKKLKKIKIAFSNPGEKQRAGVEDNALLRGAFLDMGARLSPEGGKRERPAKSVKAAGGSRAPPALPSQPGKQQRLCSPPSPHGSTHGTRLDGWAGEGVSGRSSRVLSPFTPFFFACDLNAILISHLLASNQKRPHGGEKRCAKVGGAGDASPGGSAGAPGQVAPGWPGRGPSRGA